MSNPHEQIYIEYLNYDWDSFAEFQQGLKEIMDSYLETLEEQDPSVRSIPALDQQQLLDQAKSFFYCSHTGNILNLDDFQQWKLANGDKYAKNKKISEITDEDQQKEDKLQEIEPAQEEVVQTSSTQIETPASTEGTSKEEPPYSSNYQELVELIVSGKPVPGVKDIPDTVLTEKSSVSEAKQRVKPWEK